MATKDDNGDYTHGDIVYTEHRIRRLECWAGNDASCTGIDKAIRSLQYYDFGDGTIQMGYGFSLFAGAGIRGDIGVAMDFKGNIAIVGTFGGGGYNAIGGGAGGYLTVTDAPSVEYLEGPNVQVGGQVGEVATVGAETVVFKGSDRERYKGLSISSANAFAAAPWPGEFHGTATGSKILVQFNLISWIYESCRP
jgi:hypothetical protein